MSWPEIRCRSAHSCRGVPVWKATRPGGPIGVDGPAGVLQVLVIAQQHGGRQDEGALRCPGSLLLSWRSCCCSGLRSISFPEKGALLGGDAGGFGDLLVAPGGGRGISGPCRVVRGACSSCSCRIFSSGYHPSLGRASRRSSRCWRAGSRLFWRALVVASVYWWAGADEPRQRPAVAQALHPDQRFPGGGGQRALLLGVPEIAGEPRILHPPQTPAAPGLCFGGNLHPGAGPSSIPSVSTWGAAAPRGCCCGPGRRRTGRGSARTGPISRPTAAAWACPRLHGPG